MWKESKGSYVIERECSECGSYILNFDRSRTPIKCSTCGEYKQLFTCTNFECGFKSELCMKCITSKSPQQKTKLQPKPENKKNTSLHILIAVIIGLLGISIFLYRNSLDLQDLPNIGHVGMLRQEFPSQKNETWYHILSVLEQKVPTVKSITLLYKNDKKTSDCLARKLVKIFSGNIKIKEVSFDLGGIQYRDYGEVLEHYHTVVKRFRVLVTNLSNVPSNIARVFHSLCDEVSSDIKPSLFVFTLQYSETDENLKPLEKATGILKQAWSDLPDSDMFPLLSRVVKNVVDVVPEKQAPC